MRQIKRLVQLIALVLILASCNFTSKTHIQQPSDEEFVQFANEFMSDLSIFEIEKHAASSGLYIRHNPGAFVVINKVDDTVRKDKNLLFLFIKPRKVKPVSGDLPVYDCGNGWNKKGCFCSSSVNDELLKTLDVMIEYNLSEISPDDKMYKQAEKYAKVKSYIIYDTASFSGYYFVYKDGEFVLYMIDRVDPCSA